MSYHVGEHSVGSTTPVFILSLPRSGSTLLQRMLDAHDDVATSQEPWLLLPIAGLFREDLQRARYDQRLASRAISSFLETLPAGRAGFVGELRDALARTYGQAAGGARFFIDKTPRYSLIAKEVTEIFPESPVIVLFRNPLAVAASMIRTWGRDRWNLYLYREDLRVGIRELVQLADSGGRVLAVNYESILEAPEGEYRRVLQFLGLEPSANGFKLPEIDLSAEFGDVSGERFGTAIVTDHVDGWVVTLNNPIRRLWASRYLRWLGPDTLASMGYDERDLRKKLHGPKIRFRRSVSDIGWIAIGEAYVQLASGHPSRIAATARRWRSSRFGRKYDWKSDRGAK